MFELKVMAGHSIMQRPRFCFSAAKKRTRIKGSFFIFYIDANSFEKITLRFTRDGFSFGIFICCKGIAILTEIFGKILLLVPKNGVIFVWFCEINPFWSFSFFWFEDSFFRCV